MKTTSHEGRCGRRFGAATLCLAIVAGLAAAGAAKKPRPAARSPAPPASLFALVPCGKLAPRVDLAFVLDATGSMKRDLPLLKVLVWDLAAAVLDCEPARDLRVGIVAYRDRGEDFRTRRLPLTRDFEAVRRFLDRLEGAAGGDWREDVALALHETLERLGFDRSAEVTRHVFLFGDAPAHDDYDEGFDVESLARAAGERKTPVHAILVAPSDRTSLEWKRIATLSSGTHWDEIPPADAARLPALPPLERRDGPTAPLTRDESARLLEELRLSPGGPVPGPPRGRQPLGR